MVHVSCQWARAPATTSSAIPRTAWLNSSSVEGTALSATDAVPLVCAAAAVLLPDALTLAVVVDATLLLVAELLDVITLDDDVKANDPDVVLVAGGGVYVDVVEGGRSDVGAALVVAAVVVVSPEP